MVVVIHHECVCAPVCVCVCVSVCVCVFLCTMGDSNLGGCSLMVVVI